MTAFTACHYWRWNDPFCCIHCSTPNAFQWAG